MKQNARQRAWAAKQILSYVSKIRMRMLFLMLTFFLVTTAAMAITGDASIDDLTRVGGSELVIATIIIANHNQASAKEKTPNQVKYKIYILAKSQVDDSSVFPARVGRDIGTIPLKAGEKWHYFESEDAPKPVSNVEGEIGTTIKNGLSITLGGMKDALLNFLETGRGQFFYVVWEDCATSKKFIGGTECRPLRLATFESGGDDFTGFKLTFENQSGELPANYTGALQVEDPDVVAANATTIILTNNAAYQLTDNTGAKVITSFTGVDDTDLGRVVTVFGSGGNFPASIAAANDFALIGADWVGLAGKQISFKIFKNGAGYLFAEVAGSRT